eukprot:4435799-Pyramimonas_sp.AAC.1
MLGCQRIKHWTQVQGPCGAVRLSLERVGWTVLEPFRWLTHEGDRIDVREVCPWYVTQLLERAISAWQWMYVSLDDTLGHLQYGAVWEPICSLISKGRCMSEGCKNLPRFDFAQRGYLISVIVNGQWPMSRKFEAGYVENDRCLLCDATGTLIHRHFFCEGEDRLPVPPEFRVVTDRADEPEVELLLERCLWVATQVPEGWSPPVSSI